jgi:hypothetical protein
MRILLLVILANLFIFRNTTAARESNDSTQSRSPHVAIHVIKKPSQKGQFYFYWGYNRSWFGKSDIHFSGPNYDFTVYDVVAKDRPSKFSSVYFKPSTIWIPQLNYRLGYYITNRVAVSFGVDHMKYVMVNDQNVIMSGVIGKEASEKYQGAYLRKEVKLTEDFLRFEHTNGFNLVSLEFDYRLPIVSLFRSRLNLSLNSGFGGIWLVTKTDVRVFGDGLDNDQHVAGFTLTGKLGPKITWKNKIFLMSEFKSGYAVLPFVLIKNAAPERADHNLMFYENYVVAGYQFRLWKKKDNHVEEP